MENPILESGQLKLFPILFGDYIRVTATCAVKRYATCGSHPSRKMPYKSTWIHDQPLSIQLVGGIPTPLKNMSSSVGMMTFPIEWTVIKFMFQTTNQICNLPKFDPGTGTCRIWKLDSVRYPLRWPELLLSVLQPSLLRQQIQAS